MIVAGSSADDVYVVVVFTALISLAQGGKVSAAGFLQVPVSIVLGIILGATGAWFLFCSFSGFI